MVYVALEGRHGFPALIEEVSSTGCQIRAAHFQPSGLNSERIFRAGKKSDIGITIGKCNERDGTDPAVIFAVGLAQSNRKIRAAEAESCIHPAQMSERRIGPVAE